MIKKKVRSDMRPEDDLRSWEGSLPVWGCPACRGDHEISFEALAVRSGGYTHGGVCAWSSPPRVVLMRFETAVAPDGDEGRTARNHTCGSKRFDLPEEGRPDECS